MVNKRKLLPIVDIILFYDIEGGRYIREFILPTLSCPLRPSPELTLCHVLTG